MAIKTWTITAEAINYGRLMLYKEGEYLYWLRDYHFTDAEGQVVRTPEGDGYTSGNYAEGSILWDEVPQEIKDALLTIDDYTKNQINQKEGLT